MKNNERVTTGQVVKSRAGRDRGKIFLVIDVIDEDYVYVVDGDLRKLDNPKRKKIKHLIIYNTILSELNYKIDNKIKINNAYIRKLLEPIK